MDEYEELVKDINNLKSEVERLREVVTALFQIVIETNEIDYETAQKFQRDFSPNS